MRINNMVYEKCLRVMCKVYVYEQGIKTLVIANDWWWDLAKKFEAGI
jgi:hypothetical protein